LVSTLPSLKTRKIPERTLYLSDCIGQESPERDDSFPAKGIQVSFPISAEQNYCIHGVYSGLLPAGAEGGSRERLQGAVKETRPENGTRSGALETHPRYLGLDVGNRRIGVAVSDELGLTAQPVLTLERRRNPREDLRSLARLARRFAVAGIVVGNPFYLSGEPSPQAARTQVFAAELGALTGLPVHLWDERLTTRAAHEILYEAGHARQEHRRMVDQVAATLILQSFLDDGGGAAHPRV
jgi:putative Holliday junction resolvase